MTDKVSLFPAVLMGVGDCSTERVGRAVCTLQADVPALMPFIAEVHPPAPSHNGTTPESLVEAAQRVLGRGEPVRTAAEMGLRILPGRWFFYVLASLKDDPTLLETAGILKQAQADFRAAGVKFPHIVVIVDVPGAAFGRAETEALSELVRMDGLPSLALFVVSRGLKGGGFLNDGQLEQALESALVALLTCDALASGGMLRGLLTCASGEGVVLGTLGAMSVGYQLPELAEHIVALEAPTILAAVLGRGGADDRKDSGADVSARLQQTLERVVESAPREVRSHMEALGGEALDEVSARLDAADPLSLPKMMAETGASFKNDWHEMRVKPAGNSFLSQLTDKFRDQATRLIEDATKQPGGLSAVYRALESVSTWVTVKRPTAQAEEPSWRLADEPGAVIKALRKRRIPLGQVAIFCFLATILVGQTLLTVDPRLIRPTLAFASLATGAVLVAVAAVPMAAAVCGNRVQAEHIRAVPEALKQEIAEFLDEYYEWLAGMFLVRAQETLHELIEKADAAWRMLSACLEELTEAVPSDAPPARGGWNIQLLQPRDFAMARAAFAESASVIQLAERSLSSLDAGLLAADGASVVAAVRRACQQESERFLHQDGRFSGLSPLAYSLPSLVDLLDEGRSVLLSLEEPLAGGPAFWPAATILAVPPAFCQQAKEEQWMDVSPVISAEPARLSIVSIALTPDAKRFLEEPALAGIGGD